MPRKPIENLALRRELGQRLAARRAFLGLSLAGVAAKLEAQGFGIRPQTIHNWERGIGEPGLTLAFALLDAYEWNELRDLFDPPRWSIVAEK